MRVQRIISPRRARFLRNRNEDVYWSVENHSFMWTMKFKFLNRWKHDTSVESVKEKM